MPCAMENIFAVNVGRKNKSFKPCTQHSSSALSVGGDWMCTERTARFATRAHTHLGPVLEHRRNSPSVHPILQVKRLEAGRPVVMSLALPNTRNCGTGEGGQQFKGHCKGPEQHRRGYVVTLHLLSFGENGWPYSSPLGQKQCCRCHGR